MNGVAFAVDVNSPEQAVALEVVPLSCAVSDIEGGRMFLASSTDVYAFDGVRMLWTSRRVSLDGIRNLVYTDGRVHGLANDVGVDDVPFTIDARTGEAVGGFTGWSFEHLDG